MKNKGLIIGIIIAILIAVLVGLVVMTLKQENSTGGRIAIEEGTDVSNRTVSESTVSQDQKDKRGEVSYDSYTEELDVSSFDGSTYTIKNAGTYYFYGTANDANIVVNAGDNDNVVIVFGDCNITSKSTAVVNCINAKNLYINVKEGATATLTDSSKYTELTGDDEPNATIFSKCDLLLNGKGTLVINANYNNAITGKDDLVITNLNIKVTAKYNGIKGKDSVDIKDATIDVTAENDGIKSTNEEDTTKGYVVIENSNITISAGDDGIHGETSLVIKSGKIDITKSKEGLEAKYIEIDDGTINIVASDDGINAADGSGESNLGREAQMTSDNGVQVIIKGGTIHIKSAGDGLDSNGSILQTGGDITVVGTTSGGNGALDFDYAYQITGGTLVVYGGIGMWQNPTTSSTQYCLTFSAQGNSGDKIEVKDSNGNTIESFTTEGTYSAILVSNSKISNNVTYTLYVNGTESSSITATDVITSEVNGNGFMGGGMPGGMPGGTRGGRQ